MNKADIIDKIHEVVGGTRADAERSMETVIDCITDSLKKGKEVSIAGLGISATSATICSGSSTTITATPAGGSYLWSPGGATTAARFETGGRSGRGAAHARAAEPGQRAEDHRQSRARPAGARDACSCNACSGDMIPRHGVGRTSRRAEITF